MISKLSKILSGRVLPVLAAVSLAWGASQYWNLARENTRLATENEQMIFADEGMMRSRTNFERPGITAEQVKWISRISEDYGIPEDLLYAFYATERGRRGLYMGANHVSLEIRQRYPPLWWQFAMCAKVWNKHLNRMVAFDQYVRRRTLWTFAKQWNTDPPKWVDMVLANLERVRTNGLEVTEPPKPRPAGAGANTGAKSPKAIGGGRKPSKHPSKEKKR